MVDYLSEDTLTIPGQKYALISVVSPNSKQKNDTCGVKIRGVFDTMEEAKVHANKLVKIDPSFDVMLVELYKWLPIPPDVSQIENQEYQEQHLNQLVKGHLENQVLAQQQFEERKLELMEGKREPNEFIGHAAESSGANDDTESIED